MTRRSAPLNIALGLIVDLQMTSFFFSYFGLLAGLILCTMLVHWGYAISVVVGRYWTYGESPKRRRKLLWALPMVLVLHSGPWALLIAAYLAFNLLSASDQPEWRWFFAGAAFSLLLLSSFTLYAALRVKTMRAKRNAQISRPIENAKAAS